MSDQKPNDEPNCIEKHPTTQSVQLLGRYINLSALSRATGLTPSHLSRVVRGQRTPSVPVLFAMAEALGINMEELAAALRKKKEENK